MIMTAPTPNTVVAAFADRDAAQRAAIKVTQGGVDRAYVHLHENGFKPHDADGVMLDEFATGGFFTNFAHLLDGLMNAPRKSPSYDELVQFEGVALTVQTSTLEQTEQVQRQLREAGATKVENGRGVGMA